MLRRSLPTVFQMPPTTALICPPLVQDPITRTSANCPPPIAVPSNLL